MSNGTRDFDPQKAWEALIGKGLSKEEAAKHVLRQVLNQPREIAAQYLKDIDPGALASFGLGMADMMSFGLGDQIARKLDQESEAAGMGSNGAALTQAAASANHPTAHTVGEVAGALTPLGAEALLTKAGVMAPMALTKFIGAIQNPYLRWGGKTALSAAEGALYAGAQAGGRKEGDLGERLDAAKDAAPYGAAAGAVLQNALPVGRQLLRPVRYARNILTDIVERGAGTPTTPTGLPNIKMDLTPEGVAGLRPTNQPVAPTQNPLDIPTFLRRSPDYVPPGVAKIPLNPNENAASIEIDRLLALLRAGTRRR